MFAFVSPFAQTISVMSFLKPASVLGALVRDLECCIFQDRLTASRAFVL
jgi:hypothetical protein